MSNLYCLPGRAGGLLVMLVHPYSYSADVGIDTPLIGWSMTKSVTNALIGILVKQHKISVDGPAPIAEWSDPRDPRHGIAIDHLLRMSSGLGFGHSLFDGWTDLVNPPSWLNFDM